MGWVEITQFEMCKIELYHNLFLLFATGGFLDFYGYLVIIFGARFGAKFVYFFTVICFFGAFAA